MKPFRNPDNRGVDRLARAGVTYTLAPISALAALGSLLLTLFAVFGNPLFLINDASWAPIALIAVFSMVTGNIGVHLGKRRDNAQVITDDLSAWVSSSAAPRDVRSALYAIEGLGKELSANRDRALTHARPEERRALQRAAFSAAKALKLATNDVYAASRDESRAAGLLDRARCQMEAAGATSAELRDTADELVARLKAEHAAPALDVEEMTRHLASRHEVEQLRADAREQRRAYESLPSPKTLSAPEQTQAAAYGARAVRGR